MDTTKGDDPRPTTVILSLSLKLKIINFKISWTLYVQLGYNKLQHVCS